MFRKFISILFIISFIISGCAQIETIGQTTGNVAESISDGIGTATKAVTDFASGGTPLGDRRNLALNFNERENATAGRAVFNNFRSSSSTDYPVYRPGTYEAKLTNRRLNAFYEIHQGTTLTDEERRNLSAELLPISNYLEEQYARRAGGFLVSPHSRQTISLTVYCMDRSKPTPKSGEKMRLVPIQTMLPPGLVSLYHDILSYAARTGKGHREIQGLIWLIRSVAANPDKRVQLSKNQKRRLNEAAPNGAARLENFANNPERRLRRSLGNVASSLLNLGQIIPDSIQDIANTLAELESMAVSGVIPRDNSNYTLLEPDVAARITSPGGASNLSIEIVNNSDHPFAFVPQSYAAQSTREVQRLALQPRSGGSRGFELDDGLSLLLDLIPGVSQLKSLYELATGTDPVTGAAVKRVFAAAGLIPGGKGLKYLSAVRGSGARAAGRRATRAASRVRPVASRMPVNSSRYAGRTVPLDDLPRDIRNKYPHSVPFTGSGFPDFSRYSIRNVRIELGSSRGVDFARADKAAGFSRKNPRPAGYTWHHHQDVGYMQLVPTDLHNAIKHTGGIATSR